MHDRKEYEKLSKKIQEYYKKNIQSRSIIHKELGKIDFTSTGLKKIGGVSKEALEKIKQLPKIIQKSKLISSSDINHKRNDEAIKFHRLSTKDKQDIIYLHIREFANKKDFYTLYVKKDDKKR